MVLLFDTLEYFELNRAPNMGNNFSFTDCCFPRRCDDNLAVYDEDSGLPRTMTDEEVAFLLTNNQLGIDFLVLLQCIIFLLWLTGAALVNGFPRYDGTETFHPVAHLIWAVMEFVVIGAGLRASLFSINAPPPRYKLEIILSRAIQRLIFYIVVLVFGIIAHCIHFAASMVEIAYCTSTFCIASYGFLIALVIVILMDIILHAMLIYAALAYRAHLITICRIKPSMLNVSPSATTPQQPPPAGNTPVIITPLLQKTGASIMDRHGRKFK